jgi:hypothetical protein
MFSEEKLERILVATLRSEMPSMLEQYVRQAVRMEIELLLENGTLKSGAMSSTERSRRSSANKHAGIATKNVAKVSAAETWASYSNAYFAVYGSEPVRNAMVNTQMANFVKRVGAVESPFIAAFFLTHRNTFYVQKGHAVGLLLADAEKLRTEWATNKQMTQTAANQIDKHAANGSSVDRVIQMMRERDKKNEREINTRDIDNC